MNAGTSILPSDGLARCLFKATAGFACLALLVMGYGVFVENVAVFQHVAASFSAMIVGLGVGFWPAGLWAMGMVGLAAACACALGKALLKHGTTTPTVMGLAFGMAIASVGYAVGVVLFEHTFSHGQVLTASQDAMVFVVRLALCFAGLMGGVSTVILINDD